MLRSEMVHSQKIAACDGLLFTGVRVGVKPTKAIHYATLALQ